MAIRPYRDQDLAAVAALFTASVHQLAASKYGQREREVWAPEPPDLEHWRQRLAPLEILVAESEGILDGFCAFEEDGHIDFLYTAPHAVRQGIATALFQEAERRLQVMGVDSLYTEASLVARPFFEKQGFRMRRMEWVTREGVGLRRFRMTRGPGPFPAQVVALPESFWERRLRPPMTARAHRADLIKGVILPILVLIVDPAVFRISMFGGRGLLADARAGAYLCVGLVMLWKFRLQLLPQPSFLGASILVAGALLAFLIGMVLLPLSVPGIALFGLGLLGFLPFFCGFAWMRQGLSQYRAAAALETSQASRWRMWIGVPAVIAALVLGQWGVDRTMVLQTERLLSGQPTEARQALALMKPLVILRDPMELIWIWDEMPEGAARDRLGKRIQRLTGHAPNAYLEDFFD